nr:sigma factor [Scytonema sp. UIC 10036]
MLNEKLKINGKHTNKGDLAMVQNLPQPSLEELAVRVQTAALQAKNDSLSSEQKQQALLEKQNALTELITVLMERIKTYLPKPSSINSSYIYEEALQDVLLYICKNIEKYDPEKGSVMSWVVFILKRKKINSFHWLNWKGQVTSIYKDREYKESTESDKNILDGYCPPNLNNPLPSEKLIAFIKEDPEGLLANTLFKNNPKASFQTILLKRGEEDKSWKEIVQELDLGATHGPVYTFYRRCCEKFAPYFKKHLCE